MTATSDASAGSGAQEDGPATPGVISWRSMALGLLVGVPLGALFVYLAARGLDGNRLRHALSSADPVRLALGLIAIGGIYSLQAARWRRIARPAGLLRWRTYLRFVIGSVAVNNVVPGRPGEVLRSFWLARALRISQGRALATVLVDRSSDVLVLVVAVVATYPFIPHPGWLQHVVLGAIAFGVLLMLVLGGARVWVSRRSGRGRPRPLIPRWFARQALALVHGLAAVSHADLVIVYGITVLSWMLWGVAAWLVAASVGISLTPLDLVFITAVINLGAALPSSPGFIGTFQWLSVASLGLFGIGRTEAFAFSILMHGIWYVPTTVAGALIALRAGLSRRRRAASVMTGTSSAGPESDRVAYEAALMERQV